MRLGAEVRRARPRLSDQPRRTRPRRPSARAAPDRPGSRGPTRRLRARRRYRVGAVLGARRTRAASRVDARRTGYRSLAPRASGLGALSAWIDRNRSAPSRRAIAAALLEMKKVVAVAGQRHPHPAALGQPVAQLARQRQGQRLFLDISRHARGAGIVPAMAGIDHHQRAAWSRGSLTFTLATAGARLDGQRAAARLADQRGALVEQADCAPPSRGPRQQAAPAARKPQPASRPLRSHAARQLRPAPAVYPRHRIMPIWLTPHYVSPRESSRVQRLRRTHRGASPSPAHPETVRAAASRGASRHAAFQVDAV